MEQVCIWPDGDWAYKADVDNGQYTWKSDDYIVTSYDEAVELGEIVE